MKQLNGDKQMKDVWKLPAIAPWEKSCTKYPTQKPLAVLTRLILASTKPSAWVLDPFAGSSTTGIAANLLNRRYLKKHQMNLKIISYIRIKIKSTHINNVVKPDTTDVIADGFLDSVFKLYFPKETTKENYKLY